MLMLMLMGQTPAGESPSSSPGSGTWTNSARSSKYGKNSRYCRQALVGGRYGLLDATSMSGGGGSGYKEVNSYEPTADYYSS